MSNDPDQIRADIEATRRDLSRNVDALTDQVKPGNVARRQGQKISDAVTGLKDRVMGTDDTYDDRYYAGTYGAGDARYGYAGGDARADRVAELQGAAGQRFADAQDAAGQRLSQAQQAVADAPGAARRQTQGNPLAAGLIALGVGWLIGSSMPSSQRERELSIDLKDRAAPLAEEAKLIAKDAGDTLRPGVEAAVASVKESATTAAEHVKAEGQTAADDVKASAQDAKDHVQASAQDAKGTVQSSANQAKDTVKDA